MGDNTSVSVIAVVYDNHTSGGSSGPEDMQNWEKFFKSNFNKKPVYFPTDILAFKPSM